MAASADKRIQARNDLAWGISLALPLMAIVKVLIDHFKAEPA